MDTVVMHPEPENKRKGIFRLSRLSLRHQIPLLVSVLLCAVILIFGLISYLTLKNIEIKAGKYRLLDLASQVSIMIEGSLKDIFIDIEESIPDQSVRAYLKNPSPGAGQIILKSLNRIGREKSSVYAELRDSSFRTLLTAEKTPRFLPAERIFFPVNAAGKTGSRMGNLYQADNLIYFPVIIPVKDDKDVIGYITCYRLVKITSKLLTQFSKLAGRNASLYFGNADGSLWTNLVHPVSYELPVKSTPTGGVFEYGSTEKNKRIGTFNYIKDTPWILVLEFPGSAFVYTSTQFFNWLLLSGLILIIAGFIVTWLLTRYITRPINALTGATAAVAKGNYPESVAVQGGEEVRKLVRSFNLMSEKLKDAQTTMEHQISEANQLNGQLRSLSAHMENIREEERRRIAREMHDELGQLLTGFKMDVYLLKKKLKDTENADIKEKITALEDAAGEAMQFVRKLSSELRLGPLEDLGLVAALDWYCREFTRRFQIPVNFQSHVDQLGLPPMQKSGLFRIFQESLTNVARHAHATQVDVSLDVHEDTLLFIIKDNGQGFNYKEKGKKKTLGLLGMKERAIMLQGTLKITSVINRGTTVEITVPLHGSSDHLKI
ncbi:MAG: histidine kinase [Chitinophagaceae bacterium]|nr:histidine kinase [Chitinophagaceae bacterium]